MNNIKFHFKKPEDSSGYLLWQVTMLWQRKMNQALSVIEVTHTQFVILAALAWLLQQNKMVTQKDIADHSKTDRMMVSKILRNLQLRGLIKRKEHETDTRAKCVYLTDQGKMVLQKAIHLVEKTDNNFFSAIRNIEDFNQELLALGRN